MVYYETAEVKIGQAHNKPAGGKPPSPTGKTTKLNKKKWQLRVNVYRADGETLIKKDVDINCTPSLL